MKSMQEAGEDVNMDEEQAYGTQPSFATNKLKIDEDLASMTGFSTMMHKKQMMGVNALEGRTLRQRMEKHSYLRDQLKVIVVDDDSSEDEMLGIETKLNRREKNRISKIEQDMIDADRTKNHQEL